MFGVSQNFDDFQLKSGVEDVIPIRKVAKFRQMCTQMPKFGRQIFSEKKLFEGSQLSIYRELRYIGIFGCFSHFSSF